MRALGPEARGICFSLFRVPHPLAVSLRRVILKGWSCVLRIVDDLLPPSQFLDVLRHVPAIQFLKAHSHMVSRPDPDNRKIHG